MFFGYDSTIILLIPAIIFSMIAQAKVQSTFGRYSRVRNTKGLTGAQAARIVLDNNGLQDVRILQVSGNLTDNYNPGNRTLNLSESVYNAATVSAVSVACHEAGHAIQHSRGYFPLKFRNAIVPLVNFSSGISWILIIAGIILMSVNSVNNSFGLMLLDLGILAFVAVLVFHLVTLPVEFDASNRAIKQMQALNLVSGQDISGSKKVLRAAAMTYIAAVAVAAANLLRILVIRNRS
ncbi:MAG: zinc metallopeptidase [Hornefia sp.]|nr:zinc metallopeptidase [Hornefia sp.]